MIQLAEFVEQPDLVATHAVISRSRRPT